MAVPPFTCKYNIEISKKCYYYKTKYKIHI